MSNITNKVLFQLDCPKFFVPRRRLFEIYFGAALLVLEV